jgi:hypothetical protein
MLIAVVIEESSTISPAVLPVIVAQEKIKWVKHFDEDRESIFKNFF